MVLIRITANYIDCMQVQGLCKQWKRVTLTQLRITTFYLRCAECAQRLLCYWFKYEKIGSFLKQNICKRFG